MLRDMHDDDNPYVSGLSRLGSAWFDAMFDLARCGVDGLAAHIARDPRPARGLSELIATVVSDRILSGTVVTPSTVLWASSHPLNSGTALAGTLRPIHGADNPPDASLIVRWLIRFHKYTDGRTPFQQWPGITEWAQEGCAVPSSEHAGVIERAEKYAAEAIGTLGEVMGPRNNGWDKVMHRWMRESAESMRRVRSDYLSGVAGGLAPEKLAGMSEVLRGILADGPEIIDTTEDSWVSWCGCLFTSKGDHEHPDRDLIRHVGPIRARIKTSCALALGPRTEADVQLLLGLLDHAIQAAESASVVRHQSLWSP